METSNNSRIAGIALSAILGNRRWLSPSHYDAPLRAWVSLLARLGIHSFISLSDSRKKQSGIGAERDKF